MLGSIDRVSRIAPMKMDLFDDVILADWCDMLQPEMILHVDLSCERNASVILRLSTSVRFYLYDRY